jgi:hypothetical protein
VGNFVLRKRFYAIQKAKLPFKRSNAISSVVKKVSFMFPGGESTTTSLIFIWGLIFLCSVRGCYRNFQTGDKAWGTAFGILIPASAYFLADLLNLLPPGAPHIFQ